MRILITGASGLLGLNLALEAAANHQVFGTVKDHPLKTQAFSVLQTDLLAPGAVEGVLRDTRPDWVIHCAALANLDACEADPALAEQLNTRLPEKLATYVGRGGARMLHVSTDAVFDGRSGDYSETSQPNPLSVYARTKLEGELAVLEANPEAIVARVNLFGWSMSGRRSLAEHFFNNLSSGKGMMGFTDVFFCPMVVNDLARIFQEMLEKELGGLYHATGSECTSKYDFGVRLANTFGLDADLIAPIPVAESGLKAARSPHLTMRNDKLRADLGHDLPSLSTGLQRFYTLYQQGYPQKLQDLPI